MEFIYSAANKIFLLIPSKTAPCGIRDTLFVSFYMVIIVIKLLNYSYLDMLLLHRPDTLMELEEVAEVFDCLHASGKVRHFGVSNFNSMQIELLQAYVKQPIIANQMQFSIMHANLVTSGIQANTLFDGAPNRDGHILEYCRLKHITIQAWSPFQYGFLKECSLTTSNFRKLMKYSDG